MDSGFRELMVLVPGSARVARGSQRDRFVKGMSTTAEGIGIEPIAADDVPATAVRLKATAGSSSHHVDIVEAYWNDLVPPLQSAGARARFVRGTSLILYWAFSGVWKGSHKRIYLTLGLTSAGVALVTWYYGTLAMFLQALLADQTMAPEVRAALAPVLPVVNAVGTWKIWAFAGIVMAIIPVNVLVEMLDLTKRYLTSERTDADSPPLRMQIRSRVKEQIVAALEAGDYQRLTVIGHSFGSVIALDVVADLPAPQPAVRFVTIGSPIELVKRRAQWIEGEVQKCLRRPDLTEWIDICSTGDWFASGSDLRGRKTRSMTVPIEGTFIDHIYGRTHSRYFDREEVVTALLETPVLN